eukprot:2015880-Rhodomonas_salina.4
MPWNRGSLARHSRRASTARHRPGRQTQTDGATLPPKTPLFARCSSRQSRASRRELVGSWTWDGCVGSRSGVEGRDKSDIINRLIREK